MITRYLRGSLVAGTYPLMLANQVVAREGDPVVRDLVRLSLSVRGSETTFLFPAGRGEESGCGKRFSEPSAGGRSPRARRR